MDLLQVSEVNDVDDVIFLILCHDFRSSFFRASQYCCCFLFELVRLSHLRSGERKQIEQHMKSRGCSEREIEICMKVRENLKYRDQKRDKAQSGSCSLPWRMRPLGPIPDLLLLETDESLSEAIASQQAATSSSTTASVQSYTRDLDRLQIARAPIGTRGFHSSQSLSGASSRRRKSHENEDDCSNNI
jgi:hypothetical protein